MVTKIVDQLNERQQNQYEDQPSQSLAATKDKDIATRCSQEKVVNYFDKIAQKLPKLWQFWILKCCQSLPKVAKMLINRHTWSHCVTKAKAGNFQQRARDFLCTKTGLGIHTDTHFSVYFFAEKDSSSVLLKKAVFFLSNGINSILSWTNGLAYLIGP